MNKKLKKYEDEFDFLETLRLSGITDKFEASPYLAERFYISELDAMNIFDLWVKNYEVIMKHHGWI